MNHDLIVFDSVVREGLVSLTVTVELCARHGVCTQGRAPSCVVKPTTTTKSEDVVACDLVIMVVTCDKRLHKMRTASHSMLRHLCV